MLIQLTPDEVTKRWDEIKPTIMVSMPPHITPTAESLNSILESAIRGTIQVWVLSDVDSNIYAIATTRIDTDSVSGIKSLLIFSLYAYKPVPEDLWLEGIASFKLFAVEVGCKNIIAYTVVDRIVDIAQKLGARTDTRFIMWGV